MMRRALALCEYRHRRRHAAEDSRATVLRAIPRGPDDAQLVLEHLGQVASQAPRVMPQVQALREASLLPPAELERQARRFTQRLMLAVQACLLLQHGANGMAEAFIASRFDPEWGPVAGITAGTSDPAALLRAVWA